jgi:hypothetical protein
MMSTIPQTAPQITYVPRVRMFGDDLAPPRQIYLTLIPAVLALAGVMSWIMSDDQGMVLASFVATAVAFFTLWDWLFRHAPTRFSTLLAMALVIGYGSGTLNTWFTLPRGSLTLSQVMGFGPGILARGLGATLISSASLYFLGEVFEKPIFGRDFRFHVDAKMYTFIYVGTVAMLAGYATHSIGFGGGPVTAGGHMSIIGDFLGWLYPSLTAVTVTALLTGGVPKHRIGVGLCTLVLLLIFSVIGRRDVIYTSMEIFLVLSLAGYRFRRMSFQKILVLGAMAAIMVASVLTFMLLRIAGQVDIRGHQPPTITKRIEFAGNLVKHGGAYALAGATTQTNLQKRTFVLTFLANVLDASSRITPAMGRDVMGMIQQSIPSVIYPDKNAFFSEESLVDQQFGLSYGDQPNSILTAGATDFGFFGMIAYPILLVVLVRFVYDFLARRLGMIPLLFVLLALIFRMLQTEETFTAYVVTLRDTILFGVLISLIMAMPRIRLHASPR